MRSKLLLLGTVAYTFLAISCNKNSDEILALLQEIKQQNSDLKAQVTSLQKTTDSLSAALKLTNQNIANMDKKIDSIRNQLTSMVTQINSLSAQLNQANVNIADLQKRIAELQAKCQELVDLLRLLTGTINLSDGLVAYYPFNGNANDESGNGINGVVNGAYLTIDRFGILEKAYGFNGFSSSIMINSPLKIFSSVTISAWFKGSNYILDGRTNTIPGSYIYLNIEHLGNGTIYQSLSLTPVFERLNTSKWNHIVASYENGVAKLFLNNILISQENIILDTQQIKYDLLTIGSYYKKTQFFNGEIDDIRIYNRALTQDEITYLATH